MTLASLNDRLRKIEAARLRLIVRPLSTKAERDASIAAALAQPGGMALDMAALAAEPNPAIRERSRAVVEVAWRADA